MGRFKLALKNALPAIMTVVGSAATAGGIFLAAKEGAAFKEATEGKEMGIREKIAVGIKIFAPAFGCAALSIACGVGAHMMDKKTQASLMGACVAIDKGYKKFKEKNAELNGEEANEAVMREIEMEKFPDGVKELKGDKPIVVRLKDLCDDIPEMEFVTTKYTVADAIWRANRMLEAVESLSVNDFLNLLERDPIDGGNEVGWSYDMLWNYYRTTFLDFDKEEEEDGSMTIRPVISANGGYLLDMGLIE